MTPTESQIQEMEKFFAEQKLPDDFKLNTATTINDLPGFINNVFRLVRSPDVADLVVRLRWDDLGEIRKIMEKEHAGG